MRLLSTFALCLYAIHTVIAEDGAIRDVRLFGGVGHVDVEADGTVRQIGSLVQTVGLTGGDDERKLIGVQAVYSGEKAMRGGVVFGMDATWSLGSADLHPDTITSETTIDSEELGIDILFGWAGTALPQVHIEVTPFVGLGIIQYDVVANTAVGSFDSDESGTSWRYGIRGGIYYTAKNRWQFGFEARWFNERSDVDLPEFIPVTSPATQLEAKIEETGMLFLLAFGYRL